MLEKGSRVYENMVDLALELTPTHSPTNVQRSLYDMCTTVGLGLVRDSTIAQGPQFVMKDVGQTPLGAYILAFRIVTEEKHPLYMFVNWSPRQLHSVLRCGTRAYYRWLNLPPHKRFQYGETVDTVTICGQVGADIYEALVKRYADAIKVLQRQAPTLAHSKER